MTKYTERPCTKLYNEGRPADIMPDRYSRPSGSAATRGEREHTSAPPGCTNTAAAARAPVAQALSLSVHDRPPVCAALSSAELSVRTRVRFSTPQRTLSQFLSHSSSSARIRRQLRMGSLSTWRTPTTVAERWFAELESVCG